MSNIHQLVIFWRDGQTRLFTSWNFQAAPMALTRANKILATVAPLSVLQIYGAILDREPLRLSVLKPAPSSGTNSRLEVTIQPTNPLKVGGGKLRFSIPGPAPAICRIVAEQVFSAPEWQELEQEVIAYICSPDGIRASVSPDHLSRASIARLDSDRPANQDPFESALRRTAQSLDAAKLSFQKTQTQKTADRLDKYQTRLQRLHLWQQLEQAFFDQLQDQAHDFHALPAPSIAAPASATSDISTQTALLNQLLASARKSQAENKSRQLTENLEVIMSNNQISEMKEETADTKETTSLLNTFLPQAPAAEDINLWTDVPSVDFLNPLQWTHRLLLQTRFDLNERTYYRWINKLKPAGLNRSLPAQGDSRVTLFYLPDLERALAHSAMLAISAAASASISQAHSTTTIQSEQSSPGSHPAFNSISQHSQTEHAAQLATLTQMVGDLAKQQQTLANTIGRLEAAIAEQRLIDKQDTEQRLNQLASSQAEIANKIPQNNLLDLMAQLVSLNQIPDAFKKLNNAINKLAKSESSSQTTSSRSAKAPAKSKPKSRARKSSARSKSKSKPKAKAATKPAPAKPTKPKAKAATKPAPAKPTKAKASTRRVDKVKQLTSKKHHR